MLLQKQIDNITQVGSPAVRLRLARCTAWVKQWSEAMDSLKTIFKTNIFLSEIFENAKTPDFHAKYDLVSSILTCIQKVCKKTPDFHAN